jgi:hypothetical protein
MILTANGAPLTVVDDNDEHVRGLLTLGLIERLLNDEASA